MKILDYIGGEYAINDLDSFQKLSSDLDSFFPKTINGKRRHFFETGTDSLAAIIIENFEKKSTINLYIPENYCFETIERLQIKLNHFDIKLDLNRYLSYGEVKFSKNTCLIINHFNRYKQIQHKFNVQDSIIIEDFVQAPLNISKFNSDFALNSLRKFCNLEISVCYLNSTFDYIQSPSDYYILKKAAKLLKAEFFNNQNLGTEELYLKLYNFSKQKLFSKNIYAAQLDDLSVLEKLDLKKIIEKRIENYNYIKFKIELIDNIEIIEGEYMYLMIKCVERDELKKHLASKNIFTAIHWLDSLSKLSNNILTLHIDHRYSITEMERICFEIKSFYESKN